MKPIQPFVCLLLLLLPAAPAVAQSIRGNDRTQVNHQGQRYTITGGVRSRDQRNLFHSFDELGLSAGEVANFASNSEIQNILARVTGGQASLIDGLLQVTGGNSNLYLMNPAGILFGTNARLDLPAAFHATTATGIGFDGGLFRAIGENDYASLVGTPSNFAFALDQPGVILNAGNLSVTPGQSLTLLGGTVINTGTLSAPSGQVTLTAVPGQHRVRLSQDNSLLNVEIETDRVSSIPFTPLTLPELLTGGRLRNATGLIVAADGSVSLNGAVIPTRSGLAIAAGTIDVSALGAIDGYPNAGRANIWGESATGFWGNILARSDSGKGGFVEVSSPRNLLYRGQVDLSGATQNGTLLLDPLDIVIRDGTSDGDDPDSNPASFGGSPSGVPAQVLASDTAPTVLYKSELEGITGGNVIVQATRNLTIEPLASGILTFNVGTGNIQLIADADNDGIGSFSMRSTDSIFAPSSNVTITAANITAGNVRTSNFNGGNITLSTLNPITGALRGNITVNSLGATGAAFTIPGNAGNVSLTGDTVQITGFATPGNSINTSAPGVTGTIAITHAGGANNLPFLIGSASGNGAVGSFFTNQIITGSFPVLVAGGTVTPPGGVTVTSINSAPTIASVNPSMTVIQNQSLNFNFTDFFPSSSPDPDQDNTVYQVDSILPGASILRAGTLLNVGDILTPGDILIYTPASNTTGVQSILNVRSRDLNSGILGLSSSIAALPIQINVAAIPIPPTPSPTPSLTPSPAPSSTPSLTPSPAPSPTPSPNVTPSNFLKYPEPELEVPPSIDPTGLDLYYTRLERRYSSELTSYLGIEPVRTEPLDAVKELAEYIEQATGSKPAFVYVDFIPAELTLVSENPKPQDTDHLELVIVSAAGVVRRQVPEATRTQVLAAVQAFQGNITDVRNSRSKTYLPLAQQLYQWMITPIAADLQQQGITQLVFLPEAKLRSLPFAALHSGQEFLIQQYSVSLMPSVSLTDTRYVDIKNAQLLAMGISESTQGQAPLPAVPNELNTLALQLWHGKIFLNTAATAHNLKTIRSSFPFGIVHLATHADFKAGAIDDSYIQLWNEKIHPNSIRQLGWNLPPVELLVLSACRTALGSEQAEMGLSGLAVRSGVKTVVASLWYVSDVGTASLMTGFYRALQTSPTKAEALQRSQVEMVLGHVSTDSNTLSEELSHPYYWAAFTMLGNPW